MSKNPFDSGKEVDFTRIHPYCLKMKPLGCQGENCCNPGEYEECTCEWVFSSHPEYYYYDHEVDK